MNTLDLETSFNNNKKETSFNAAIIKLFRLGGLFNRIYHEVI